MKSRFKSKRTVEGIKKPFMAYLPCFGYKINCPFLLNIKLYNMSKTIKFFELYWINIVTIIIITITSCMYYHYKQQINELDEKIENDTTSTIFKK